MKTYNIFNNDNEHLYVLRVTDTKTGVTYILYASNAGSWADFMKNTLLLKVTNTGSGLTFEKTPKRKIDYPEAEYLRIILHMDEISTVKKYKPRLKIVSEDKSILL